MSKQTNSKVFAKQKFSVVGLMIVVIMSAGASEAKNLTGSSSYSPVKKHLLLPGNQDTTRVYKTRSGKVPNTTKTNSYINLYQYLQGKIKYSKTDAASGNVLVSFNVDGNHKVSDVKLKKGLVKSYDENVVRNLTAYPAKLFTEKGSYVLNVEFNKATGLVIPNITPAI